MYLFVSEDEILNYVSFMRVFKIELVPAIWIELTEVETTGASHLILHEAQIPFHLSFSIVNSLSSNGKPEMPV